jgi:putative ABC transport system substrate-binding protein
MKRRELMLLLGATMVARSARAQRKAVSVVGYLGGQNAAMFASYSAGFREGLREMGYVEGQNLVIEYRWAEGRPDRLPALAADLVGRKVDVIVASGGEEPAIAAKNATSTIPIVGAFGDPVVSGLVDGLARPGGNINRRQHPRCGSASQASRTALRAGSRGQGDCPAREPEQFPD